MRRVRRCFLLWSIATTVASSSHRDPIAELIAERGEAGITLLQVGANDASANPAEVDFGVRRALADPRVRAVLVEANPLVFASLETNLARDFGYEAGHGGGGRITALNMAVCGRADGAAVGDDDGGDGDGGDSDGGDAGGRNLTFYVVSPRLRADFPTAPHWVQYQLSSFDHASIHRGVAMFLSK